MNDDVSGIRIEVSIDFMSHVHEETEECKKIEWEQDERQEGEDAYEDLMCPAQIHSTCWYA